MSENNYESNYETSYERMRIPKTVLEKKAAERFRQRSLRKKKPESTLTSTVVELMQSPSLNIQITDGQIVKIHNRERWKTFRTEW